MLTETEERIYAGPWKEFCKEINQVPLLHGPAHSNLTGDWDKLVGVLASKLTFPAPDTSVTTKDIKPNSNYWIRVYTPPDVPKNAPLTIYIHGGGWAMGSVDQEDAIPRIIAKACNTIVVSVEYRLAPAHIWPAAHEDCYEATRYAVEHAAEWGADASLGVVISGASAGGNLAISTALRLIDEGQGSKVSGVVAMVPVTVHPDAVPEELKSKYTAYDEHAEHTVNTKDAMEAFFNIYNGPKDNKYLSPLLHPGLKALPRVYITESGTDTLRDDARLMKEKLESEGVQVKYDAYEGYPHYSWTFPSQHLAGHAQEFFGNLADGIKWCADGKGAKL